MSLSKCFDILEIPYDLATVTLQDARDAYRLVSQIWHPDKYCHNQKLFDFATTKMKVINAAKSEVYDFFMDGNAGDTIARHGASEASCPAAVKKNYSEILSCPSCGAVNTVKDIRIYTTCEACSFGLSPRWHDTITDYTTKLTWPYDGNIARMAMTLEETREWLNNLKYRYNVKDWRLPTKEEFTRIALGIKNPPSFYQKSPYEYVQDGAYWIAGDKDSAIGACMINGEECCFDPSGIYHVWPVRTFVWL